MVHAESPGAGNPGITHAPGGPGSRRYASALTLLVPTFLTAAVAVVGVFVVPVAARIPVAWCGAAAVAAVALTAAEAARRGRRADRLTRRLHEERERHRRVVKAHIAETERMAVEVFPRAIDQLKETRVVRSSMLDVSNSPDLDPEFRDVHRWMIKRSLSRIQQEQHVRDALQSAFVNIARRMQAIVNTQAADLRHMEDKYGNENRVFFDILKIDHGNALLGRLADTISVLGGSRPGRQWTRTIPLYSVLRGGMSRIVDYRRVELHRIPSLGIKGDGVEPVIHALAELLDNACRYSPPHSEVRMTAVEVPSGLAIEIEDCGIGLTGQNRERGEKVIRQKGDEIDFDGLTETPKLGYAVVGRICKMYGFQVRLRESAYGGVRAVMIVPSRYITTAPAYRWETSWAHGIGAQAGQREDTSVTPRSVAENPQFEPAIPTGLPIPRKDKPPAEPLAEPLAHLLAQPPAQPQAQPQTQPQTPPQAQPQPQAPSQPQAQPHGSTGTPAGSVPVPPPGYYEDDEVIVTEWTEAGLPQRRRDPSIGLPLLMSQRLARKAAREAAQRAREAQKPWQPPGGEWLDNFLRDVQADRKKQEQEEREREEKREREAAEGTPAAAEATDDPATDGTEEPVGEATQETEEPDDSDQLGQSRDKGEEQ